MVFFKRVPFDTLSANSLTEKMGFGVIMQIPISFSGQAREKFKSRFWVSTFLFATVINSGCSRDVFTSRLLNQDSAPSPSPTSTATPTPSPTPQTPTPPPSALQIDTRQIPIQAKMDLLFVIDNSHSMIPFQQQVSASVAQFISQFVSKDIDFRFGVATTMSYKPALNPAPSQYDPGNTQSPFFGYLANSPAQNKLISRFPGELWLNRNSPNLVTKFGGTLNSTSGLYEGGNANVGAFSNNAQVWAGKERLDDSFLGVIQDINIGSGGINAGFLRPDAQLAGVLISDEDRSCVSPTNVNLDDTYCTDTQIIELKTILKNRLDQLVQTNRTQGYSMKFVINSSQSPPTPAQRAAASGVLAYPYTYQAMADAFGSPSIAITSNFAPQLITLGGNLATQAQLNYQLTETPLNPLNLIVRLIKLDGTIETLGGADYQYQASSNSIVISQARYDANRGATIQIEYQSI